MQQPRSSAANETHRSSRTQAIERALAVLEAVRDAPPELGILQIADEVDLSPSTVHRMVSALSRSGYLAQNHSTGRYHLGRSAVRLGVAAERNLGLHAALPVLERLGAHTGESINLGVRDGMSGLVLMRVLSPQPLRFDQQPGTRASLHASAMGKCLLAFAGDVRDYLASIKGRLEQFTDSTITTARALRRELATTRERGYSIDDGEFIPGLRCIGSPVLDTSRHVQAAIAIQAPAVRMPDTRVTELAADIMSTAKEVAELLPVDRST